MKRLLIVVDYQNDSVSGSMGFPKAELLEKPICDKVKAYKARSDAVAFTLDTHYGEKYETDNKCEKGWGWQLYGELAALCAATDKMISKHTCASLDLLEYLIAEQFDSIELCGVLTNVCVLSNAILAKTALPEADILIDANCVASNDERLHSEALDILAALKIRIENHNETP